MMVTINDSTKYVYKLKCKDFTIHMINLVGHNPTARRKWCEIFTQSNGTNDDV